MSTLIKHYFQLVGIAKTWALKTLPGWSDELHRDLLQRHGAKESQGRVSASTMRVIQLSSVLDDYEKRGWPRKKEFAPAGRGAGAAQPKPVPPRIALLVRLWGKLGQAGKVAQASRGALLNFCARQVARPVPDLDSLAVNECQQITEALKSWLARE